MQVKVFRPSYIVLFFAVFLVGFFATEYLALSEKRALDSYHSLQLKNKEGVLRSEIERVINTTLQLSSGLIVYVAANPEVKDSEFATIVSTLIENEPLVLNVGLAKDNVITHVYPLEGNEKALGLDYMRNEKQRGAVLRAMQERRTVIAGPVDLVQGGRGLIGRIPIYLGPHGQGYWGIASVVVDFDAFIQTVLRHAEELGIEIALKGRDAKGKDGELFLGRGEMFDADAQSVVSEVTLPVGSWLMASSFVEKPSNKESLILLRSSGYFITLIIAVLSVLAMNAFYVQKHLSLHDSLTGLPNRRLFDDHLEHAIRRAHRNRSSFALIFIDLNNFKQINDQHGHKAGDSVLTVLGARIEALYRGSDVVARYGGDEFVAIMENAETREDCDAIIQRLSEEIAKPIETRGGWIVASASVGIALYPDDGDSASKLLAHADEKMYRIKRESST